MKAQTDSLLLRVGAFAGRTLSGRTAKAERTIRRNRVFRESYRTANITRLYALFARSDHKRRIRMDGKTGHGKLDPSFVFCKILAEYTAVFADFLQFVFPLLRTPCDFLTV